MSSCIEGETPQDLHLGMVSGSVEFASWLSFTGEHPAAVAGDYKLVIFEFNLPKAQTS